MIVGSNSELPVAFLTRLIWQESSFSTQHDQSSARKASRNSCRRQLMSVALPIRSIPKKHINPPNSGRPQATFRQSWTGRRRLQCRSCRCCDWLAGHGNLPRRDPGLRSDHHATSGRRLDRRGRGGNDNRQRNILEAILFTNDSRHSPLRTSVGCHLSALCALGRPARRQFFEGGGAGRLRARQEQLFRYRQDRTHGHRRSRAQPRLRSILSGTRTCALARGS